MTRRTLVQPTFVDDPEFREHVETELRTLTEIERRSVNDVFRAITNDKTSIGIKFFLTAFNKYPSYQNFFSFADDKNASTLGENKSLMVHSMNVLNLIETFFSITDDPKLFYALLLRMKERHRMRLVTRTEANDFVQVFAELVLEAFPNTPALVRGLTCVGTLIVMAFPIKKMTPTL